jgi:enoyl-CoA hydratase
MEFLFIEQNTNEEEFLDWQKEMLIMAERICANAPIAVRERLAIAKRAHELSEEEAWARRRQARTRVMQTADAQEGPGAFAEKREPHWTGR